MPIQDAAASAGMGLILGAFNDQRQLNQQRALNEQQYAIDNRMAEANYQRQIRMWNETNYGAQVEQMKKAGLNPALMYSKGGPGGALGNPAGAVNAKGAPIGGMEIMNMMMNKAQMELIKAQTNKTNVEANKLGGVDTTKTVEETNLIRQNIKNAQSQKEYTEAMTAWQQLETKFATQSYGNRQRQIEYQLDETIQKIRQIGLQNDFTEQTWDAAATEIEQRAIGATLQNELLKVQKLATEKGIEVSNAEIQKIGADIAQGWTKIRQEQYKLGQQDITLKQNELQLLYNEMKTKFEISHPGLWNVIGGSLETTIKQTVEGIQEKLKRLIPKL